MYGDLVKFDCIWNKLSQMSLFLATTVHQAI